MKRLWVRVITTMFLLLKILLMISQVDDTGKPSVIPAPYLNASLKRFRENRELGFYND
jgi:hypothetical protein